MKKCSCGLQYSGIMMIQRSRFRFILVKGAVESIVCFKIIEEEMSGYKAGVLTAEQTADKIQNRVQLYLNEQERLP